MTASILLVEDDKSFTAMVRLRLQGLGYRVKCAARISEAMAAMTPDIGLVIADGLLPDGTGITLVEKLRETGYAGKVIFVSSVIRDKTSFIRLTRDLHVDALLHKPLAGDEIAAQVERLIGEPPQAAIAGEDEYLAALCDIYRGELPAKLEAIASAVHKVRHEGSVKAITEAAQHAHRIHGTAGSLGFTETSETAGNLEACLHSLTGLGTALEWQGVEAAFSLLTASVSALEAPKPRREAPAPAWAKLLYVSANPANVKAFQRLTRENAALGVVVHSERDALASAHDPTFDAVLIDADLGMKQEGLALSRRIRSAEGLRHLPIGIVGNNFKMADRLESVQAGASVLIDTPLNSGRLRSAAEHLLALRQNSRAKVMIVDDDVEFGGQLMHMLRQAGHEAVMCNDPLDLLPRLELENPTVLILDQVLPQTSGLELCRLLRSMEQWKALPILLLTARTGTEIRVAAFKAGADDYLAKPLVKAEFLARVQVRIDRSRLIDAQANHDGLTGLLNRRAFVRQVEPRLSEARRNKRPLAISILDVDKFKRVNDEQGHMAGDRALIALGTLISSGFRVEDLRARWGGEEFVMCFSGEDDESAKHLVERLLAEFKAQTFEGERGSAFSLTFSAGIAAFPGDGNSFDELMRIADQRLYEAKSAGRCRVMNGRDTAVLRRIA